MACGDWFGQKVIMAFYNVVSGKAAVIPGNCAFCMMYQNRPEATHICHFTE